MASPLTHIEDLMSRREQLVSSVELMENHLADPQRSPKFGMLENSEDVTEERIADLKRQIAEIDALVAKVGMPRT